MCPVSWGPASVTKIDPGPTVSDLIFCIIKKVSLVNTFNFFQSVDAVDSNRSVNPNQNEIFRSLAQSMHNRQSLFCLNVFVLFTRIAMKNPRRH